MKGELFGETLERFRSFYLSSEDRREKVRFAELFYGSVEQAATRPVDAKRAWFAAPWRIPHWGLAGAVCLIVLVAVYLLFENLRLRNQVNQAEARSEKSQQRARDLEKRLEEQQRAVATSPAIERTRALICVAFVLAPPTRSGGSFRTITLPGEPDALTSN